MNWSEEEKKYLEEKLLEIREGYDEVARLFFTNPSIDIAIKNFIDRNIKKNFDNDCKYLLYVNHISKNKFYKFYANSKEEFFLKLKDYALKGVFTFPVFFTTFSNDLINKIKRLDNWLQNKYKLEDQNS